MLTPPPAICDVARIFADTRIAQGSRALNHLSQVTATGSARMSGLTGVGRLDYDFRGGRYAQHFNIVVMGTSAEVYDGNAVWEKDISGGVHSLDAWFPRQRARTDAFIQSGAYLDSRVDTAVRCLGTRREQGRQLWLLGVQPHGGIPAVLAIDVKSHLLAELSERFPTDTVVTRYDDYRTVDGTALPFLISRGSEFEPDNGFVLRVRSYALHTRTRGADFERPRPAANALMLHGVGRGTLPLRLEARQLLVWASINGRAPMPFILDTGGHAILTTLAARALGLHASGNAESGGSGSGTVGVRYARVRTIRLGAAELLNQPMLVIDYPYAFYERGQRTPLAGILGLEIFEHFAAHIDYFRGTITLSPASSFAYKGLGKPLPLRFQDDMPLTSAEADGRVGLFGVDTGNAGTLILFSAFLRRTGLDAMYAGGSSIVGRGTGGTNTGRLQTLHSFVIGDHIVRNVPVTFTRMRSGSFSSWTEAGNVGFEVLGRFVPTFDYAHHMLYLDRCKPDCVLPVNRYGLHFTKDTPMYFVVTSVLPGSAAANAGLFAGDRIVAINETPASHFSAADLFVLISNRGGVPVRLTVLRGSTKTQRVMRLAERPGRGTIDRGSRRRGSVAHM